MPKSDQQDDAMLCRLYDADRLMKLLKKDEETILPPEFHKPLNLEYKVCHVWDFLSTNLTSNLLPA